MPDPLFELLPEACRWIAQQEAQMLQSGVPLNTDQLIDAHLVGVKEPERVRLWQADHVPQPDLPVLKAAADRLGFVTANTWGMAFRYGIFIRSDQWNSRALVAHELTHTAQYERLGGIEPFMQQYLEEVLTLGYPNGPLELEAQKMAEKLAGN